MINGCKLFSFFEIDNDCYKQNMVLFGSNINEGEIVNSVKECQELCQDNNDCKAFTVKTIEQHSKCWLKKDAKQRMSQQSTISGPKKCRK